MIKRKPRGSLEKMTLNQLKEEFIYSLADIKNVYILPLLCQNLLVILYQFLS